MELEEATPQEQSQERSEELSKDFEAEEVEFQHALQHEEAQPDTSVHHARKIKKEVLDRIIARVNGLNILLSDLQVPRINTGPFSLDRAIAEKLYRAEAARRSLLPSATDVEKRIASIKSAANLSSVTDDEFEKYLLAEGFTLKHYKREMARMIMESNVLSAAQQERLFVTRKDIEAYCKEHPEYVEDEYLLKTAVIPLNMVADKDAARAYDGPISWVESGWLKQSEIGAHIRGVLELNVGERLEPIVTNYGYQLVELEGKNPSREKPVDERYAEVERTLIESQRASFETMFLQELKDAATIVYLDPVAIAQAKQENSSQSAAETMQANSAVEHSSLTEVVD